MTNITEDQALVLRRTQALKRARHAAKADYLGSPRFKYISHRAAQKKLGKPWDLTYTEWLEVWLTSGRWPERGRGVGKYSMQRIDKLEGWTVGNVEIHKQEASKRPRKRKKPRH